MTAPNPTVSACTFCGSPVDPRAPWASLCTVHLDAVRVERPVHHVADKLTDACPTCKAYKEALEDSRDHAGVALFVSNAKLGRELQELRGRHRAIMGKQGFPVEVNGPANILAMLDPLLLQGREPNLESIREQARKTVAYIQALGRGERPPWHTVKA